MKNFFKNLILSIVMCLTFVACDLLFKTPRNNDGQSLGNPSMKLSYEMTATEWQVDSICKADTLPTIDTWILQSFIDYESGDRITKRMYIKEYGDNEVVYIIVGVNEPYKVTRRITE